MMSPPRSCLGKLAATEAQLARMVAHLVLIQRREWRSCRPAVRHVLDHLDGRNYNGPSSPCVRRVKRRSHEFPLWRLALGGLPAHAQLQASGLGRERHGFTSQFMN